MAKSGKPLNSNLIIQFRADETLMAQLTAVAARLHTSVGVLARQWVAERLYDEVRLDKVELEHWRQKRLLEITKSMHSELEPGPVQVIHMQPWSQEITIDPDSVRSKKGFLAPVERTDEYMGRINLEGFRTTKIFSDSKQVNGYVQVFRTGQLESVRVLQETHEGKAIFGDQTDDDLIRSTWSYAAALSALKVPAPAQITVTILGLKGYRMRTRLYKRGTDSEFEVPVITLPSVDINDWLLVSRMDETATLLRASLDVFWNAAGFDRSTSFNSAGKWRGLTDPFLLSATE